MPISVFLFYILKEFFNQFDFVSVTPGYVYYDMAPTEHKPCDNQSLQASVLST